MKLTAHDPAAAPTRIIDSHVHFVHLERMEDILALMDAAPCAAFNLVSLPNRDGTHQNNTALTFKERHPDRVFACGALNYGVVLDDLTTAPARLAEQVRSLRAQSFDGLKLIEGKPEVRKLLPHPLDGPLYAPMWAAVEEMQLPAVVHIGDPDEFWDAERCPSWARQSGWDYSDGTYPTKEQLYAEIDHVLARHPRLRIVFAHFYFLSRDLERAARFLDAHPSVCFDLAPHMDMYTDFSEDPSTTRDFFLTYQERILYGTDTDTRAIERGPDGVGLMRFIPRLIRAFLEHEGALDLSGSTRYRGLGLPRPALEAIYHANFERLFLQEVGHDL